MYKSDFKDIFLNLQQMGKVHPYFERESVGRRSLFFFYLFFFSLDIRILSTKGCLPLSRSYTRGKNMKNILNVYKIGIQRDFFCNKWSKW